MHRIFHITLGFLFISSSVADVSRLVSYSRAPTASQLYKLQPAISHTPDVHPHPHSQTPTLEHLIPNPSPPTLPLYHSTSFCVSACTDSSPNAQQHILNIIFWALNFENHNLSIKFENHILSIKFWKWYFKHQILSFIFWACWRLLCFETFPTSEAFSGRKSWWIFYGHSRGPLFKSYIR